MLTNARPTAQYLFYLFHWPLFLISLLSCVRVLFNFSRVTHIWFNGRARQKEEEEEEEELWEKRTPTVRPSVGRARLLFLFKFQSVYTRVIREKDGEEKREEKREINANGRSIGRALSGIPARANNLYACPREKRNMNKRREVVMVVQEEEEKEE